MSSILETFYILFESNADKAKKGYDDAKRSADDFDKKIGNTDEHVHAIGERMVDTFKEVGVAIAAAFAVDRIKEFILQTAELNDALGKTAKSLDIDIGDLYAWGEAAARSGGSAEGFQASLSSLNRGMADMAAKGRSRLSPFFDELGIKMLDAKGKVRPLQDLLLELATAFEKIGKQESSGYAEKLGLDTGTMMLLQSGRRAVEDLVERQRQLGTVTEKDAEIAEKFNDQWDDTKQMFRGMATAAGSFLLPAFTAILKGWEKVVSFFREHKPFMEGLFVSAAGIITAIYLPAIASAIRATAIWLAQLALAAAPFVLTAAAIAAVAAAIAFLYDDVMNFLQGNDSVIGELSKKWPIIGDTVRAVADGMVAAFNFVIDYGKALIDFYIQLGKLIGETIGAGVRLAGQAFDWFVEKAQAAIHALFEAFPGLATAIGKVGDGIMGVFRAVAAVWDWMIDKIKTGIGWVKDVAGWIAGLIPKIPGAIREGTKGLAKATAVVAAVGAPAAAGTPAARPGVESPAPAGQGRPAPAQRQARAAENQQKAAAVEQQVKHTVEAVNMGKAQIAAADRTPIGAHTTTAINQSRRTNKTVNVKTGNITINTPATDAGGIAKDIGGHLENQIRQAVNHMDDGVDR